MRKTVIMSVVLGSLLIVASSASAGDWFSNRVARANVLSVRIKHYGSVGDSVQGNIKIWNKGNPDKYYIECKVVAKNRKGRNIGADYPTIYTKRARLHTQYSRIVVPQSRE